MVERGGPCSSRWPPPLLARANHGREPRSARQAVATCGTHDSRAGRRREAARRDTRARRTAVASAALGSAVTRAHAAAGILGGAGQAAHGPAAVVFAGSAMGVAPAGIGRACVATIEAGRVRVVLGRSVLRTSGVQELAFLGRIVRSRAGIVSGSGCVGLCEAPIVGPQRQVLKSPYLRACHQEEQRAAGENAHQYPWYPIVQARKLTRSI